MGKGERGKDSGEGGNRGWSKLGYKKKAHTYINAGPKATH